jgi:hypothetical protein
MPAEEREIFIIGRRIGHFRTLSDFHPDEELLAIRNRLIETFGSIDAGILEILKNYGHL